MLQSDSTLVDFGANVDVGVLDWAAKSDLGGLLESFGVVLDVLVPVTAEPLAVTSGLKVMRSVTTYLPTARRTLVLNEHAGLFGAYERDSAEYRELLELKATGMRVVEMPRCQSEGWVAFEKQTTAPVDVVRMAVPDISRTFSLNPLEAHRGKADLATWMQVMQTRFRFLLDEPQATS
jgi:hypothetical protein